MSYSNQKYYTRQTELWGQAVDFGTSGATTVAATNVVKQLPTRFRKTKINKIRMRCTTIPNAAATNLVVSFLNGTDTFGTVAVTTATADQTLDVTITSTNATLAANVQPTVSVSGTATGASDSLGDYDIWAEVQEVFA